MNAATALVHVPTHAGDSSEQQALSASWREQGAPAGYMHLQQVSRYAIGHVPREPNPVTRFQGVAHE